MTTFLDMLGAAEQRNQSLLCVGLDPDITRLPEPYQGNAGKIYDFCAAIVDATADLALAYKPQIAYFAAARAEEPAHQARCAAGEHKAEFLRHFASPRP